MVATGVDLAIQLHNNGGNWGCVDWTEAALWGGAGAIAIPGIVALAVAPEVLLPAFVYSSIWLANNPGVIYSAQTALAGLEAYGLYDAIYNGNQDTAFYMATGYQTTNQSALVSSINSLWSSITQKNILLMGFRGTGFSNPKYSNQPGLIQAGHVGVSFDNGKTIYGFSPSETSLSQFNSEKEALKYLVGGGSLPGQVYDDTNIFIRAANLSSQGALSSDGEPLIVYWNSYSVPVSQYTKIQQSVIGQFENPSLTTAQYMFPQRINGVPQPMPPGCYNCATFPISLGLPIPEVTGQLAKYIPEMIKLGALPWYP